MHTDTFAYRLLEYNFFQHVTRLHPDAPNTTAPEAKRSHQEFRDYITDYTGPLPFDGARDVLFGKWFGGQRSVEVAGPWYTIVYPKPLADILGTYGTTVAYETVDVAGLERPVVPDPTPLYLDYLAAVVRLMAIVEDSISLWSRDDLMTVISLMRFGIDLVEYGNRSEQYHSAQHYRELIQSVASNPPPYVNDEELAQLKIAVLFYCDQEAALDIVTISEEEVTLADFCVDSGEHAHVELRSAIASVDLDFCDESRWSRDPNFYPFRLHPVAADSKGGAWATHLLVSDKLRLTVEVWDTTEFHSAVAPPGHLEDFA